MFSTLLHGQIVSGFGGLEARFGFVISLTRHDAGFE